MSCGCEKRERRQRNGRKDRKWGWEAGKGSGRGVSGNDRKSTRAEARWGENSEREVKLGRSWCVQGNGKVGRWHSDGGRKRARRGKIGGR
jgi:hypothetical protein